MKEGERTQVEPFNLDQHERCDLQALRPDVPRKLQPLWKLQLYAFYYDIYAFHLNLGGEILACFQGHTPIKTVETNFAQNESSSILSLDFYAYDCNTVWMLKKHIQLPLKENIY